MGKQTQRFIQDHQAVPCRPDWAAAPDWAQFCAKDADGDWHWFSHEPSVLNKRHKVWRVEVGKVEFAFAGNPSKGFRKDLYARPVVA